VQGIRERRGQGAAERPRTRSGRERSGRGRRTGEDVGEGQGGRRQERRGAPGADPARGRIPWDEACMPCSDGTAQRRWAMAGRPPFSDRAAGQGTNGPMGEPVAWAQGPGSGQGIDAPASGLPPGPEAGPGVTRRKTPPRSPVPILGRPSREPGGSGPRRHPGSPETDCGARAGTRGKYSTAARPSPGPGALCSPLGGSGVQRSASRRPSGAKYFPRFVIVSILSSLPRIRYTGLRRIRRAGSGSVFSRIRRSFDGDLPHP
jgi:hypothetical protein